MCQASQCYKVISSGLDTEALTCVPGKTRPSLSVARDRDRVWGSQSLAGKVDSDLWSEIIMDGRIVNVSAGRVAARNIWCGGLRWCSPVGLCLSRPNSALFVVNCYSRDIIIIPSGCVGVGRLGMMMRPEWWEWWDVTTITIVITVVSPQVTPSPLCSHLVRPQQYSCLSTYEILF